MENAETILIIILSVTLILFLIIASVLFAALIKLTRKLSEIADKAEAVAGNVVSATDMLRKTAGPLAVGKFLANIADVFIKRKRGK
jgi:uncharacterized protein (DUF58 family)